jgi:aspartyl-tRNA(Asn)/glutamyl-tRNA(Gln) amidotransferase subunit C
MSEKLITKEDVRRVAELSMLDLTDEEVEKFASMFSDTLNTIDTLSELDTEGLVETYQVTGLTNVFQEFEKNKATLPCEEALKNASQNIRDLFATKAVFDR